MTSELSFLLDLLLNHRMPLVTKELVAARIKLVEEAMSTGTVMHKYAKPIAIPQPGIVQAPSTQAILDRNPDLAAAIPPPPVPIAMVAQTPATTAALNARQQAISEAMSGKVDKETGAPKKFRGSL